MPLEPYRWSAVLAVLPSNTPLPSMSAVKSSTTSSRYTAVTMPDSSASMPTAVILSTSKMAM